MSLADFQAQVDDLVRDKDGVITTPERDSAIQSAVLRYADDRPQVLVADLVGMGSQRVTLPTAWLVGFSILRAIEWPVGNVPASYLDAITAIEYQTPTLTQLELPFVLAVSDTMRLTYTAQHTLSVSADTIPIQHRLAVCCLAGHMLSDQLSAYYATEGAPTIGADTVNHATKTETFRTRARVLRERYFAELGIDDKRLKPASATKQINTTAGDGKPRLFRLRGGTR